jgi:1-phosphofructokinase family hexose kinase
LNPALDKVLYLDKVEKNITSRIKSTTDTIGGKGTHVSINLKLMGMDNRVFGISHGSTGEKIVNALNEYGLDVHFIQRDYSNSRTNYLLIESTNDCTVIADKGVQLTADDLKDIISQMKQNIQPEDYLVFSGDASNCSDPEIYNTILKELKDKNLKVFLDTSGETLKSCISLSPYLIKPNLDELSTLCGREVTSDIDDLVAAIDSLSSYNIEVIAVSLGKHGSVVKIGNKIYKASSPDVKVFNTVGCGDSFLAGLVYCIYNNMPFVDSIKFATAISAATAESALSVGYDSKRANELIDLVEITEIR